MARGELTPTERALWRRVAATVRPMPGREPVTLPPPAPEGLPTLPAPPPMPAPRRFSEPPPFYRPPPHPEEATLDGQWDRAMRTGRVEPDMVIDLHGLGLEAAHGLVERRIADAAADGLRLVLVITGKGSRGGERRGVIRASLADWLSLSRIRPAVAAMRPAHPRHGGGGAFYVVLKRQRG